jgi:hypothetical protein
MAAVGLVKALAVPKSRLRERGSPVHFFGAKAESLRDNEARVANDHIQ